ncbi:MAG: ABC transporter permease subunit [Firmicutes bacterium]|mgnify:CR=1 FL=1|nr:ABC transporter permease subunit [Bacillota bacterium]
MSRLITCIYIEGKKLLRSRTPVVTTLALTMIPFMGGFFMFVLKDPALALKLGFISTKAQLLGSADWPSYFNLLTQAIAIGGILVFGFVTSWIFGREYSDRTVVDLLAVPTPRSIIVLAKFIVATLWCFALSLYVLILGYIVGKLVNIPAWSFPVTSQGAYKFLACSLLTISLSTPVGLVASIGRGYLPPLAFTTLALVLAQIMAAIGYGHYFPWSIPALVSGITGGSHPVFDQTSLTIVLLTSTLGLVGTILWWQYADQY